MNLANKITISRILLIPFFIAFVLYSKLEAAFVVFIIAAISDALDGYVARVMNQRTELGEILDPLADKALLLSAFICLSTISTIPAHLKIPAYVLIIVISRDAIIVFGIILIHFIKGSIAIRPSPVGKITTFFQMLTILGVLIGAKFSPILWNAAVVLTIISGAYYIKEGSRLLSEK